MMFLLLAGAQNSTWAATVTYHILTLPINPTTYDYNMTIQESVGFRIHLL